MYSTHEMVNVHRRMDNERRRQNVEGVTNVTFEWRRVFTELQLKLSSNPLRHETTRERQESEMVQTLQNGKLS